MLQTVVDCHDLLLKFLDAARRLVEDHGESLVPILWKAVDAGDEGGRFADPAAMILSNLTIQVCDVQMNSPDKRRGQRK